MLKICHTNENNILKPASLNSQNSRDMHLQDRNAPKPYRRMEIDYSQREPPWASFYGNGFMIHEPGEIYGQLFPPIVNYTARPDAVSLCMSLLKAYFSTERG